MKRVFSSLLMVSSILITAHAQVNDWCGTHKRLNEMLGSNPQMQVEFDSINTWLAAHEGDMAIEERGSVKVIPTVVHIIHNYGAENVSDARVYDAIRFLNEDFLGTSTDLSAVVTDFQSRVNNPQLEFRLATLDPNGNCTNGITRTVSYLTYDADDASKVISWPRNKYYNIWVVFNIYTESTTSVTAGYSYLPSNFTGASVDGTILAYNYFGLASPAFQKRVLSHETGHWFNLQHTFGNVSPGTGDCSGSDGISDTPLTSGSFSTCVLTKDDCGPLANVQNIMDYSSCTNMFTTGQATRMTNAANSGTAGRSNLWTNSNLIATGTNTLTPSNCTPIADFHANKYSICVGSNITFYDNSWNATVTSRQWTFTNGTTTINDTNENPTILFTQAGIYDVSLSVSAPGGNNNTTRMGYVYVFADTAEFSFINYTDDYEGGPITNDRWHVLYNTETTDGWRETNLASVSTNTSIMVHNYALDAGQIHTILSPSYDFTSLSVPTSMTFKVAFARKVAENADQLKVYASSNCGQTWMLRGDFSADDMVTGGLKTNDWYPNSLQWKTLTISSLNAFSGKPNVRFKFEFITDGGNNLFIDNLNLSGPLGLEDATNQDLEMNVYPNPAEDIINIDFAVDQDYDATFSLVDITGKTVTVLGTTQLIQGDNHFVYTLPQDASAGLYFLRIQAGNKIFTHKIILQ